MNTGINTKELNKRNKRARKNLALKLSLEDTFKPEIRRYFNNIIKIFQSEYRKTGEFNNPSLLLPLTKELLTKQYRRVGRAFNNEMKLFITEDKSIFTEIEKKQNQEELSQELIDTALSVFIENTSNSQSALMDRTTDEEIQAAINQAQQELLDDGEDLTNESILAAATLILKQKFSARVNTTAITETQLSSEATKQIEATVMSREEEITPTDIILGSVIGVIPFIGGTKEWATILDQVTRPAHVEADGQKKQANDPFIVGGELLRYPGDPNGSAGNVINCRCSALYSL